MAEADQFELQPFANGGNPVQIVSVVETFDNNGKLKLSLNFHEDEFINIVTDDKIKEKLVCVIPIVGKYVLKV